MLKKEEVIEKVDKTLSSGRAIATGIGVFGAVFFGREILLRKRIEKGSLINNEDLSGKWELPGGGVDIVDLESRLKNISPYQAMIMTALDKELNEEVCLELDWRFIEQVTMLPAWLAKDDVFDLAFVIPLDWNSVIENDSRGEYFPSYTEGLESGAIRYFAEVEISSLEIISPRMRFMIQEAFRYYWDKMG